jgi:hypothetical protein
LPIWRTEDKQEVLIGSVEEYNEIENQFRPDSKREPFKGFKKYGRRKL